MPPTAASHLRTRGALARRRLSASGAALWPATVICTERVVVGRGRVLDRAVRARWTAPQADAGPGR